MLKTITKSVSAITSAAETRISGCDSLFGDAGYTGAARRRPLSYELSSGARLKQRDVAAPQPSAGDEVARLAGRPSALCKQHRQNRLTLSNERTRIRIAAGRTKRTCYIQPTTSGRHGARLLSQEQLISSVIRYGTKATTRHHVSLHVSGFTHATWSSAKSEAKEVLRGYAKQR